MQPKIIPINDSDIGNFDLDFYEEVIVSEENLELVNEEEYQEI
jgi:hypothetical protein